jgi:hypothetical protein
MMFRVLMVLGIAGAGWTADRPTVLRDTDDGKVRDRWVVVGALESQYQEMRRTALEYAKQEGSKRAMFRLILGDSDRAVFESVASAGEAFPSGEVAPNPFVGTVARVFGLGGNAMFSFRSGNRFREENLIGHSDPTSISQAGVMYQVLNISLTQMGPASLKQPDFALRVFVRSSSSSLSVASAVALTKLFCGVTNASLVNVAIRTDEWFINDREYPKVLPFLPTWDWGTRREAVSRPFLICGNGSGGITCSGQKFSL